VTVAAAPEHRQLFRCLHGFYVVAIAIATVIIVVVVVGAATLVHLPPPPHLTNYGNRGT